MQSTTATAFLSCVLQNNKAKEQSSAYFGGREQGGYLELNAAATYLS